VSGSKPTHTTVPAFRTQKFPHAFHLKRQRLIRPLFDKERDDVGTISVGSIRLLYRTIPVAENVQGIPVQAGFSAGRRQKAVTRNRIKRILKEVYRKQQAVLIDLFKGRSQALTLMVLYRGSVGSVTTSVPRDLPEAIRQLVNQLESRLAPR